MLRFSIFTTSTILPCTKNDAVSKTFLHSDVAISEAPGMLESGMKLVVASM